MGSELRVAQTSATRLVLDDEGIVTTRPLNLDQPRTAEMVTEILDGVVELTGSRLCPVLWIPGDVNMRPGGWQVLVDRVGGIAPAVGIVQEDEAAGRLGAFPSVVDALMLPVRVFTSEADARQWLLQFVASPPDARPTD
jgi:hypothetical protein